MSCFAEDHWAKGRRWCCHCSKCARMYLFLMAWNLDPKRVGFRENLFLKKYRHLYSAFGESKNSSSAYDSSLVGQGEQLLAFLFALRQGQKGELINHFKKSYLKSTEARENKLRRRYLYLQNTDLAPKTIRNKVIDIFKRGLTI